MTTTMRRTKIIATLGPSTDTPGCLEQLLTAGVDAVRLNFSHGTADDHTQRVHAVRAFAKVLGKEIGIIADLQGPKIRISRFAAGPVVLKEDAEFILDATWPADAGTVDIVGIDYKELPQDVSAGDTLLFDDGRLTLKVESTTDTRIVCRVIVGGELSNHKGINRAGGGLSAKALTDKDRSDLQVAVRLGVDYIAVSFPRSAADIEEARALLAAANGSSIGIIAKIERCEAVVAMDEIINASDAVMVARGDLGVEVGDAELPGVQKQLIHRARILDKAVITATQMMESMIVSSIPTRAEVFDVANAVLDGTDAVMLSAETASGKHPAKVVEAMARICLGAEQHPRAYTSGHRVECQFGKVNEAVAMAVMYTANHFNIRAIIAFTESGATPLWMSRIRSGIPIFGLSPNIETLRKMTLYRGVYPLYFADYGLDHDKAEQRAVDSLKEYGATQKNDYLILTRGEVAGLGGGTNIMKITQVV